MDSYRLTRKIGLYTRYYDLHQLYKSRYMYSNSAYDDVENPVEHAVSSF